MSVEHGDRLTRRVGGICSLAYFTSYIMRLGFAAGLVEITSALGISQSSAGLALTGLFITYGAGQFLSGYLGDRIAPRVLITFGLLGAAVCNVLLALSSNAAVMTVIWCVNGIMQAMLWPPLTRLLSETLDGPGYMKSVKWVTVASNIATIVAYAMMSAFARAHVWQGYFYIAAAMGVAVSAVFLCMTRNLPTHASASQRSRDKANGGGTHMRSLVFISGLPLIMLAIVMQGMLRDGVTTWMPSLITQTAGLGASASILSTAVLPLFSVLCVNITAAMQRRVPNDTLSSMWLFGIATIASAIMLPLLNNAVASIICMAVITGCAHAINFLLICHVPSFFAPYNCVSSVSGLINSCTYIGSALSTYGVAIISDLFGWHATVGGWLVVSALGLVLCLLVKNRWQRFTERSPEEHV